MPDTDSSAEPRPRLLVVDDEPYMPDLLGDDLREEGYDVAFAGDGWTAWLCLMAEPVPDLVVLDWTLPDMDGPDLCQRMREAGINIPVLMLTGHDDVSDRVRALDAGVDDYLVKPFAVEELLARLRALRRRRWAVESERPDEILKFGDLLVNLTNQQVVRAGSQIKLSSMEYRLLLQLLQHLGSFQKPTELLASVWGEEQQGSLMLLEVYAESLIRKIDAGRPTQLIQKMDDGSLRVLIGE